MRGTSSNNKIFQMLVSVIMVMIAFASTDVVAMDVEAVVFDYLTRKDFTISHSGVLAHEIRHVFVHETEKLAEAVTVKLKDKFITS